MQRFKQFKGSRSVFRRAVLAVTALVLVVALAACSSAPKGGGTQQPQGSTQQPQGSTQQPQGSTQQPQGSSESSAPQKVYTLRFQNSYPPTLSFYNKTGATFIELIERWSEGRIKFEVFEAGAVVPVGQMLDAVHTGVLDVGKSWGGFYVGDVPEADVEVGLPLAWQEPWEVFDAYYNRGLREVVGAAYESKFNVKHFPAVIGMQYAISTTKEIKSLDDLKGLKLRALGVYGEFAQALGASPVVVPGPELFTALQLGTIDGLIYDAEAVIASGLEQFIKTSMADPQLNAGAGHFLINKDTWNSLPPDLQQVIEDAVKYGNAYASMQYRKVAEENVAIMKGKGVNMLTLSAADRQKALNIAMGLWDKVGSRSQNAAKGVEIVKQQLKDYGR